MTIMKAKHLTLDDRKAIQEGIERRLSKTAIAKSISKDPTTVAKEIKLHRTVKQRNRFNSPVMCAKLKECKKPRKFCSESCIDYVEQPCTMRDRSTGACNHCEKISRCRLDHYIASSFNCIETFKKEIKVIDAAIEREIKGLNPNAFIILQSIDGIGPVFAGGIIAEIGDIAAFHSSDALAKYAGLMWKSNQSGDFDGEDTPMSKAGNRYLRYYLGEAANSMKKHNVEYGAYYRKKYNEVPKHQHKRALALTSRKFVRLVYGLLAKKQLYSGVSLDTSTE